MVARRSAGPYLASIRCDGAFACTTWSGEHFGEMLDLHKNRKILGIGLAANVLGCFWRPRRPGHPCRGAANPNSAGGAGGVCVTLRPAPLISACPRCSRARLLAAFSELPPGNKAGLAGKFHRVADLSERESQVASLLLEKKTYKAIGEELFISENTVKYYVKNIYSKCGVQSRGEFIGKILAGEEQQARP